MIINRSGVLILFAFYAIVFSSTLDTVLSNTDDISKDAKIDTLKIPLYEQYKVTSNYHLSQPFVNIFRWTTVGIFTGASIGGIMDAHEQDYIFIPSTVIAGGIGMGTGFFLGTVVGVLSGFTHEDKKADKQGYHVRRCRFGYDVQLFTRSPILNNVVARYEDQNLIGGPDITIVYRTLTHNVFVPDNVSLGYFHDWWGRHSDYSVSHYGRLKLKRIESRIRYDIINLKLLIPYWSVGLGYSWGLETEEIQEPYFDPIFNRPDSKLIARNEYDIKSPILRGYIGSEFNLFDFCYADFKIGYEMIGPYLFLNHKEYFPYVHNFLISFSIGTFIF